jgi:hypothetical protein
MQIFQNLISEREEEGTGVKLIFEKDKVICEKLQEKEKVGE